MLNGHVPWDMIVLRQLDGDTHEVQTQYMAINWYHPIG
jgi:hypothetical protein